MQLGAAGVLGTLWQVDDLATALVMAKFYDLHIDEGLRPSAALKSAQIWLRDATTADLLVYSKSIAAEALDASAIARLEDSLKSRHRPAGRLFAALWNVLHEKAALDSDSDNELRPHDGNLQLCPFAHPYYWGGFVHTGL
jgi:CHAT domain-containing protein